MTLCPGVPDCDGHANFWNCASARSESRAAGCGSSVTYLWSCSQISLLLYFASRTTMCLLRRGGEDHAKMSSGQSRRYFPGYGKGASATYDVIVSSYGERAHPKGAATRKRTITSMNSLQICGLRLCTILLVRLFVETLGINDSRNQHRPT